MLLVPWVLNSLIDKIFSCWIKDLGLDYIYANYVCGLKICYLHRNWHIKKFKDSIFTKFFEWMMRF